MLVRRQFLAGLGVSLGGVSACATSQSTVNAAAQPRPATRGERLDARALEDALVGSTYLGCGGGGGIKEARALIADDLAAGLNFQALKVDALGDSERVACPYALASLAPMSADMQARLDAVEGQSEEPTLAAFRLLERHLGTQFSAVILGEIGPLSMAEGLSIAARLGVPALDADTVGRATPEINQHSVRVAGYPLTPAAGATPFGDEVILQGLKDPSREEDIFRALSVVSRVVGVADAPITGAMAKTPGTLVTGSLTLSIEIGRAAREARAQGKDPIEAARQAGDGYTLFEGRVTRFNWRDEAGFLVGDLDLSGTGEDMGRSMRLEYKNEHLVAQIDGDVVATCPDLITLIDNTTHEGIGNPDFEENQSVTVLAFRADPLWRTAAGLSVFAPRYFGYDHDYIPVEQRLGRPRLDD